MPNVQTPSGQWRPLKLSRRRLDDLSKRQVELAHLKDVGDAPPESGRQIRRELLDQLITIVGLTVSALLLLDNSSADLPIGGSEDRVDRPARSASGLLERRDNPVQKRLVGVGSYDFQPFGHLFPE